MRTSPVHYIAPSAISIIPNANGSANDLAVYVSRGTKIKVYCPRANIKKDENGEYQEWSFTGRNRRLADSTKPYTIYARLPKNDKNGGYLVFAKKTQRENKWIDAYSGLTTDTTDGYYALYTDNGFDVKVKSPDYFYVRLGDVSLPDANNQRTVTLDTGILGTDQFNDEWALRPDELPLRIELGCTINDEDAGPTPAGPTPYVYWGQSLVLTAMLTEGWTGTDIQRFDRWEIIRNSGDAAADNAWNNQEVEGQDTLSPRLMSDGQITLQHIFGGTDDFNGAVSVTFTILAVGHNADTLQREILRTATINIMAETVATYELEQSAAAVTYNPLYNTYSPANVVTFRIRTKAQDGSVSFADDSHIAAAQLCLYALPEGDAAENRTSLIFTGGIATLPVTDFAGGKSINLWLENGAQVVLARTTVAYIRYGEKGDTPISIYRWYKVGLTPQKPTSTSSEEPAPAAGDATGAANVYPTDKWRKTAPDRPATGEWALWMCGSIRHGNGAIDAWSTPVRISGDKGTAGEDGSDREYIYIRTNAFPFSGTLPANISTGEVSPQGIADGNETDKTQDDWVPNGWSDTALPADNDNRYVYIAIREKPAGAGQQWGPFGNPVLWSNWGVRGTDGDGVEHVFIRTQNNVAPIMNSIQTGYAADEFRPTITAASQTASLTEQAQTTDDPKGPNSTYPYEWVATRSKGDAASDGTRQWTRYTGKNNDFTMSLWSRWAEDGVPPEQIYIHTSSYPYNGSTPASVDADGNVPSGWSATPVGVSQQYPYEYRSVRRKTGGAWGAWSTPQLDAKWSSDGTSISIKGDADMVIGWGENLPMADDDGFRCLMNNSNTDDMEVYEIDDWQQLTGSWQGYSADIGDIYLIDGNMWMKQNNAATASSPRWKNLGRIQGPAGTDGKNAVRIDLDNQADIIACREDGTVRFTRIVTVHASIHDGDSLATAGVSTPQTVADMAIAGVTPTTFSLVDGLLTVTWQFVAGTVLASGSYAKDITLNYNGKSYTAQFSLTSSNTSAVYQLHPSMSEVSFQVDANGSYTPPTQNIYCGYTKTDGGGTQTFPGNNIANLWREGGAPYNIFWRRQLSGGTFSYWNWAKDLTNGTLTIDSSTTDMGIEFAMSSAYSILEIRDENIVDRELVAIVKGGKNGPKGDDAQEVNPNILLRTIFDRGIDFVSAAWYRSSDAYVTIDTDSGTVVNGRKSIRLNAKDNGADTSICQNLIGKLKANTWYTLSFNAFLANGGGRLVVTFYNLFDGTRTNIFGNDLKVILDGEDYQVSYDGLNDVLITGDWDGKRHTITFLTNSSISTETLDLYFYQAYGSGTGNHSIACICMPKLEEGRVATAYMAHEDDLKGDNAPYNEHVYALSQSRTSHADGDLYQVNGVRWFPSAPDPRATHPYVWERIMHYTAAGVNDQTSYICLTGAVGAMGKLCYMAGEYREDVEYTSNDSQTVAVEVSGTNDTTDIYYLNAESNWPDGTAQSAIGPTDSGQKRWVQGMSQYNLVRARYLFADFAQFGAAVVSGDWLISVHGTINGTAYEGEYTDPDTYINGGKEEPTYFWFDPAYPNEDHAGKYKTPGSSSSGQWASDHHNFIPHYAVNLLTGKTYQNDAYIRGEVHATSGDFVNVKVSGGMRSPFTYITPNSTFNNDFSDNLAIYSTADNVDNNNEPIPTSYNIPWDSSQSGRRIIVANYKWGNGTQVYTGYVKINAPAGKYFFEDGIQKSSIYMSREVIELVGYGDSSNFYGWIVLTRTDLGTNNRYGHNIKALAMGVVNVTGSTTADISGYYNTFDKSEMTIVKDGVGKYTFRFGNTDWFNEDKDVFVVVTGCGGTVESATPVYANLHSKDKSGFTVWTGDDKTLNDGSFSFIVMNFSDWSSIIKDN